MVCQGGQFFLGGLQHKYSLQFDLESIFQSQQGPINQLWNFAKLGDGVSLTSFPGLWSVESPFLS